jgi:putative spermidine/putrescine transport system ATP-binding protein
MMHNTLPEASEPMTAEKTAITLTACGKTFADGTRALQPIDLAIAGGETVVLLGPSGCGKTTLLRIVAGLESPDSGGRVLFNGEDVTVRPIERREVGMVFQSYALFPNMSVRQNVAYGLKVRRVPREELTRRVDDALEMMQIAELAERRIGQLSGGQRQRVALARAIAVRPRILLLDEPLTALDALLRDRLRVEIDGLLRGLGITAVYVTHDQAEAMALGDRVVVMSAGRIEQIGPPRDIYHAPATDFVADFIGTVNRVPAAALAGWGDGVGGAVLFRPEDAEIVSGEGAHLRGRVASSLFLGDRTRLVLESDGLLPVVVDTRQRETIRIGEEIGIRLKPDHLIPLPSAGREGQPC